MWEAGTHRERWKTPATSKSVPAISAWDHHTITQHQLKTLPLSCPFMLHFSAADADSISTHSKYFHYLGCSSSAESYKPIHMFKIQHLPEYILLLLLASLLIFLVNKYFGTEGVHVIEWITCIHITCALLLSSFSLSDMKLIIYTYT